MFTFILFKFHILIFHLNYYVTISNLFDNHGYDQDKDLDSLPISFKSNSIFCAFPV